MDKGLLQVAETLQKYIRDIYLLVDDYPHSQAQHQAEIKILYEALKSAYEQGRLYERQNEAERQAYEQHNP